MALPKSPALSPRERKKKAPAKAAGAATAKQVAAFLAELHLFVTGRPLDPSKLAALTRRAGDEGTLAELLAEAFADADFRQGCVRRLAPELIRAAYRGVLGREPDQGGLALFTAQLGRTAELAPILTALRSSVEFSTAVSKAIAPAILRGLGQGLYGRAPDDGAPPGKGFHDVLLRTLLAQRDFEVLRHELGNAPAHRVEAGDSSAVKTILLHLPKTGGTTLHEALAPHFESERVCPERFDGLHRLRAGDLARYRFFSGHFSLESCQLIPGAKRIVTMLRHPLDRLVSHYNFLRAHSDRAMQEMGIELPRLARAHSLREYFSLEEVRHHPSVDNTMVRALASVFTTDRWENAVAAPVMDDPLRMVAAAKKNLASLLAFGILERYPESIELIFGALGLPAPAEIQPRMVLRELMGRNNLDRIVPQRCDPAAEEVMAPLIAADLELYQFGVKLFAKNLAAFRKTGRASGHVRSR